MLRREAINLCKSIYPYLECKIELNILICVQSFKQFSALLPVFIGPDQKPFTMRTATDPLRQN